MDYWVDKPDRFIEDLEPEQVKEMKDQHYKFTNGNGVALIKSFLTTKFPINIDYINMIADRQFDDHSSEADDNNFLS